MRTRRPTSFHNNNNNNRDDVWCCHHDKAIARVHRVHLMNADSAPRWPPTLRPSQPTQTESMPERNGSNRPHPPSPFYYYSARELILILPSHGGWKAESTYALQCSPCQRLYIAVALVINTTARGEIRTWVLDPTPQSGMLPLPYAVRRHCHTALLRRSYQRHRQW